MQIVSKYGLHQLVFIFHLLFIESGYSQVRIVQISDAHSSLETIVYQLSAIEKEAKDFYSKHENGEFIIFVNGDFTSLNSYSRFDQGQISIDFLKILKQQGYTVLFNPGNHDAFDWTGAVDGVELFLKQMQDLVDNGIPVLTANFHKPKEPLKSLLSSYYVLRTLSIPTAIVGMTIENLIVKSNMNQQSAATLFKKVASYEDVIDKILPKFKKKGIQRVFIGIHDGHERLRALVKKISKKNKYEISFPLFMAGDDHLVSAYNYQGALISDGGSHGSFNVIDISQKGDVLIPIRHVSMNSGSAEHIKENFFPQGQYSVNPRLLPNSAELLYFADMTNEFVQSVEKTYGRVLVTTSGIPEHKMHLKQDRSRLGDALSQALILWARELPTYIKNEPIIAMVNSSSYRIEEAIPAGNITEMTFRMMYPFLNEAAIFRLKGEDIEILFKTLQKYYGVKEGGRYTPQMNKDVRFFHGRLQIFRENQWEYLEKKRSYLLVLDGWLASTRFGQGPEIREWLYLMSYYKPLAVKSYQDVLVEYLPYVLRQEGFQFNQSYRYCRDLFL